MRGWTWKAAFQAGRRFGRFERLCRKSGLCYTDGRKIVYMCRRTDDETANPEPDWYATEGRCIEYMREVMFGLDEE